MPEHSGKGRKTQDPRKNRAKQRRKNPPTRKGKVAKTAMVRSRARIVETKSRIQSDLATIGGATVPQCKNFTPINGVFHFLPLHAYTLLEQGLGEDQMIGQSLFSKYLNAKLQVRFAGGANQITDRQFPMELICGWVRAPTAWTSFTSPAVNQALPSHLSGWIVERVSEYFNSRTDKLDFIPKRDSTIDITYRRRIVSNQSKNNVLNPTATDLTYEGHAPDKFFHLKWHTMKKVFYERGASFEGAGTTERRNYYPNYSKIPFMVIYSPNYAGEDGTKPIDDAQRPTVSYNVAHYFTDS